MQCEPCMSVSLSTSNQHWIECLTPHSICGGRGSNGATRSRAVRVGWSTICGLSLRVDKFATRVLAIHGQCVLKRWSWKCDGCTMVNLIAFKIDSHRSRWKISRAH